MSKIRTYLTLLTLIVTSSAFAQLVNDECFAAEFIPNVTDYCSGPMALSNDGASSSDIIDPSCWDAQDGEADVWYYVRPRRAGLLIRLFGQSSATSNTLSNMALAVYSGSCGDLNQLICQDINDAENTIESTLSNLTIGAAIYFRISSELASAGTFELCIEEFNPVAEPESDCVTSVVLCDKSTFFVENLNSVGLNSNEIDPIINCVTEEFASAWYTWTAATSGTLTFTLTPTSPDPNEDLDFSLFRLNSGLADCSDREIIRCMASGETAGNTSAQNAPCLGPTGLREGASDETELPGCTSGDDNFLAPIDMIEGESYALLINNFSQSQTGSTFGFTIEFGGTGTFLGPTPDFNIIADQGFQCEQSITFTNLSVSATDDIDSWQWNFGEGAVPATATGPGPHDVIYSSFGSKIAALTIETQRGCMLTDIEELQIEECCTAADMFSISPQITGPSCAGFEDGSIFLSAGSGSAMSLFSFEGSEFSLTSLYNGLSAGSYNVAAINEKGCEATLTIVVEDPSMLELSLSAGMNTVQLGRGTSLSSTVGPDDRTFTYLWSPAQGLSCTDCPSPDVIPPGTTTYTLSITDQFGCIIEEEITIFTNDIKNFYAPNAITPNSAINNVFKVFGNAAVDRLEFLEVYDRWGNVMYTVSNIELDDPNFEGWNGMIGNQKVNPGVFVWIASIRYIDGEIEKITGDFVVFD